MRSVRSEMLSGAIVLSIPVGISLAFPREALRFRALDADKRSPASVAFVRLSADEERVAMRVARTSWQGASGGSRVVWADLSSMALPDEPRHSVLSVGDRVKVSGMKPVMTELTPFLPSVKAPPPVKIAADDETIETRTFSRDELLKID